MVILLLLAWAFPALSQCPIFSCSPLQTGLCARRTGLSTVDLNTKSCASGEVCSVIGFQDWWDSLTAVVGETYPCQAVALPNQQLREQQQFPYYFCGNRTANTDFIVGTIPRECESSADCGLIDGTVAECKCGLRGHSSLGYCQPSLSSSEFNGFWNLCQNQFIQDYDVALYYTQTWVLYPYLQDTVSCADKLFYELKDYANLTRYYEATSAAVTLAVGAFLWLS